MALYRVVEFKEQFSTPLSPGICPCCQRVIDDSGCRVITSRRAEPVTVIDDVFFNRIVEVGCQGTPVAAGCFRSTDELRAMDALRAGLRFAVDVEAERRRRERGWE